MVLFDIDGTLIRRAGPHHRQALVEAIREVTGADTTTEDIQVAGMLDRDILAEMMRRAGLKSSVIRDAMPRIVVRAQEIYIASCPDLQRKVCPGVRRLLRSLNRRDAVLGLVTGNLTRIAWKKMEHAGLKRYFRFGSFAELAKDRAGLIRLAIRRARQEGWIDAKSPISFIGDHPNDIKAARANHVRAIAVATGLASMEELASHAPDVLVSDLRALDVEMLC